MVTIMAIKTVVESDLSGKTGASTFTFAVGNVAYEIDLTAEEREEFEAYLKDYAKKGRKASIEDTKKPLVPETTRAERTKIRQWGRENDFDVPERGKIPTELQKAYDEAHGIDRNFYLD